MPLRRTADVTLLKQAMLHDPLVAAADTVRQKVVSYTDWVMELHTQGRQHRSVNETREAIEGFMRRQGWLPND